MPYASIGGPTWTLQHLYGVCSRTSRTSPQRAGQYFGIWSAHFIAAAQCGLGCATFVQRQGLCSKMAMALHEKIPTSWCAAANEHDAPTTPTSSATSTTGASLWLDFWIWYWPSTHKRLNCAPVFTGDLQCQDPERYPNIIFPGLHSQ